MSAYGLGPAGATTITPAARESFTKIAKLEVADAANAFAAASALRPVDTGAIRIFAILCPLFR